MQSTVSKPRILVVEDEAIVDRDIRQQLTELGYEPVGHATRGEQAIALAGELRPDLVLMDVQLAAGMDGVAAAQAIRTQFSLPVVFLTAFADDEMLERAKLAEPFGTIVKPFTKRELRTVLELALYKDKAEAKLRESERRFRTIFNAEPECVKLLGPSGDLLEMNSAGLAMLEAGSVDEVRSHGLANFIRPEYRAAFGDLHRRVMGGTAGVMEYGITGLRGTRLWLETHATPMRDADGRVTMTLDITRDISARKQAESALRESEERYRQLVNLSPYAIGVYQRGKIVLANRAAVAMFGETSAQQLIGQSIQDLIHPEHLDAAQNRIERMLKGESGLYPTDDRYRRLDGSLFDVEVSAAPFTYQGLPAVQVIALDITKRKRAESALRETTRQLQALSRRVLETQETERRRVAHELHDELGQALTAIKINLQSRERFKHQSPDELNAENLRIVDDALQQVRRLALALRPSILDDLGLTPALRWIAEQTATRSQITVNFHPAMAPVRLASDIETACFRIVQEALTNVVRHAGARQVEIELRRDGDALVLRVHDDGCGFDLAVMRERAVAGGSIGVLGMQERAALIGGQLDIRSTPGNGCTVQLRCPWRTV